MLVLVISLRTFIFEPFFVPTGSMKPGILEGDYVFATKYNYGYNKYAVPFIYNLFGDGTIWQRTPKRGDVVIFFVPEADERYIKRVIGLPGDKIQISAGSLYINDRIADRSIVCQYHDQENNNFCDKSRRAASNTKKYDEYLEILPNGSQYHTINLSLTNQWSNNLAYDLANNTKAFYVPPNKYFFMGDNRDNSHDSRMGLGFVDADQLIGKAHFLWFSTAQPLWVGKSITAQIKQIWYWFSSIRWQRIFKSVYIN